MIPALWRLGLLLALRSRFGSRSVGPAGQTVGLLGAPGSPQRRALRVVAIVWLSALALAALVVIASVAVLIYVVTR